MTTRSRLLVLPALVLWLGSTAACINSSFGTLHQPCGTFDACDSGLVQRKDRFNACVCEISCRADGDCPKGMHCRHNPPRGELGQVCAEDPPEAGPPPPAG